MRTKSSKPKPFVCQKSTWGQHMEVAPLHPGGRFIRLNLLLAEGNRSDTLYSCVQSTRPLTICPLLLTLLSSTHIPKHNHGILGWRHRCFSIIAMNNVAGTRMQAQTLLRLRWSNLVLALGIPTLTMQTVMLTIFATGYNGLLQSLQAAISVLLMQGNLLLWKPTFHCNVQQKKKNKSADRSCYFNKTPLKWLPYMRGNASMYS